MKNIKHINYIIHITNMYSFHSILKSVFQYFGRYRLINDRQDKEPYLERYYLFLKDRTNFPFNIFLHKFLNSDPDDLHNHPWSYISIPLYPGYWEHTDKGKFWRGPLSCRYAPASTYHRIELIKDKPYCWTLFIPGKKFQDWGFMTSTGWIQNEKYLNTQTETKTSKMNKITFDEKNCILKKVE